MAEAVRAEPRVAPRFASWWALAVALLAVVTFWWGATGVTIAMQRDLATRRASLCAAVALAAVAARMLRDARHRATAGGAFQSFAGGALLWAFVSTLFYGGWVTGVRSGAVAPGGPSLALAAQAVAATLHADLVSLAVLAFAAAATRGAPNRVGLWTLVVFWGAHQTAKLNVFFGVRHPGVELLPRDLAHLADFFGPARNSALLPVTVSLLAAVAGALAVRAARARTPFARAGAALLAALTALALLEHVLLGTEATLPLWDGFVRLRGA